LFPSLPSVKILCDASTYLSTEGNEAKEELVFQRNANSNFVFLPRNSLQKETKEMKAFAADREQSLRYLLFKLLSPPPGEFLQKEAKQMKVPSKRQSLFSWLSSV